MGFQRAGLLAWHLDACKSRLMVWSREVLQTAGLPLPALGCTLKLTSVICKRYLGSCLGFLNKGELNTESIQLLKGHLSPDFRGEERTVCGVRPQPLCRQKWWALSPLPSDRKQTCREFVRSWKHCRWWTCWEELGLWEIGMIFFLFKKMGQIMLIFPRSAQLQGLVTYSWEG